MNKINIKAFTLAEVLITLGIIGVVAAITIPTLLNNTSDQAYKTAYKKAYSLASQAWLNVMSNNENVDLPNSSNQTQRMINFAAFKSKFQIAKSCGDPTTAPYVADISGCWASGETWFGLPTISSGVAFVDNSGMSWALTVSSVTTNVNDIIVDTNGLKGPNKYGQDRFYIPFRTDSGASYGTLSRMVPVGDCLSTSDCLGTSYLSVCPSVVSHPCYYSSWILN